MEVSAVLFSFEREGVYRKTQHFTQGNGAMTDHSDTHTHTHTLYILLHVLLHVMSSEGLIYNMMIINDEFEGMEPSGVKVKPVLGSILCLYTSTYFVSCT